MGPRLAGAAVAATILVGAALVVGVLVVAFRVMVLILLLACHGWLLCPKWGVG